MNKLTNVHDAMIRAVDASKPKEEAMTPYPFKAHRSRLNQGKAICERNGTTLPEFFRQCLDGLIHDYDPTTASQTPSDAE